MKDMIKVYMTNITNCADPKECPEQADGLPIERRERILRYTKEESRRQGLASSLLLQHVLQLYGKSFQDIRYGQNKKPEVEGLHFNISHSHEIVVCAVSDLPVGCDVEKIGEMREKIVSHFFTSKEIMYLNQYEGIEKENEFYRLWTMKESYMKMTGEGMKLSLKRIEFILPEPVKVYRDGQISNCFIKEYEVSGYKLTVCGMEQIFFDEVIEIKLF